MNNGILMEMTIDEVRAFRPEVVLMGVASVEPHGPVLPYGTDYYQSEALARRAVELANAKGARALMYPTLPIGNNVNFKAFPFACRIGVETLIHTLLDIFKALEEDGMRKVVLINSHGGNTDAMRAALRIHTDRTPAGERAFVCIYTGQPMTDIIKHPSDHGGERETANMMNLHPSLVKKDKLGVFPVEEPAIPELKTSNVHFVKPWHLHVPMSAGGDVREATAEKGRRVLERNSENLAELLVALSRAKWHPDFPYRARGRGGKRKA